MEQEQNKRFLAWIDRIALQAILWEVAATPKPGLVDRNNCGAHRDMCFGTFMDSTAALSGTFGACAKVGLNRAGRGCEVLLEAIRPIGLEAEQRMFAATGGVNTHKGLLFSLGILSAAAGYLFGADPSTPLELGRLCRTAAVIAAGITSEELTPLHVNSADTHGEWQFIRHGITGARGEAESGFATVRRWALPVLREGMAEGRPRERVLVQTLLSLMAEVEDTNVLHRAGETGLKLVQGEARKVIALGGAYHEDGIQAIEALDHLLIQENISPGGSADLLAVAAMLWLLENGDCGR